MSEVKEIVVVAVSSVGGPALGKAILDRHRAGAAHFRVVVPERFPNHGLTWTTAQVQGDAEKRLSLILELLADMGVDADGEVTSLTDPPRVIDAACKDREVDEIIVVQGAPLIQRLSDKHKVNRLDKAIDIPVTQVLPDDESDEHDYDPEEWETSLRDWALAIEASPETD